MRRISPWRNGKSVKLLQNRKQVYSQQGTFRRISTKKTFQRAKGTARCDTYFSFPYRWNTSAVDLMIAVSVIFSPMMIRKWIQRGNLETLQRRATPSPVMQEATGRIVRPENLVPKPRTPSPRHRFFRISFAVVSEIADAYCRYCLFLCCNSRICRLFKCLLHFFASFLLFYFIVYFLFNSIFYLENCCWICFDTVQTLEFFISCILYLFLIFFTFFFYSNIFPSFFHLYVLFYFILCFIWGMAGFALILLWFSYINILYKYLPYILISFLWKRKLLVF